MSRGGRFALAAWLVFLVGCAWLATRAQYTADLSAFLPRAPTPEQQLLVDQLKSGVASRLILIGIEGGDRVDRARASRELAARLRADRRFLHIANGETPALERDRELLFAHRYLLSPAVSAERFTVEGLRAGVEESLGLLATSTGLLSKSLLARDPTGEFVQVLDALEGGQPPHRVDGVWASRDGTRALLLARTRAEGADTDGQAQAVGGIRTAFATVAPQLTLALTGPGPFSVTARATIKDEVTLLSGLGALVIVSLLLLAYRSPKALLLSLVPVLTGALAGVAAVSLGFGVVHGVTLGFGTALIGEAVDYSIYLLMQSDPSRSGGATQRREGLKAFWPTVRIGVLTSVFGFASLLFSGFPGLAQLGLYAIAGLVAAALVTRFVLPHLVPATLSLPDVAQLGPRLLDWTQRARRMRGGVLILFVAACGVIALEHERMWNRELASLSPVPAADQALDAAMRADLGAPDVAHLVIVSAPSAEAALAASERAARALDALVAAGKIAGYESPARYLPSQAAQRARLAALPADAQLRQRFATAVAGLPLKAERFEAFFADVAEARRAPPLTRSDLEGGALAAGVDALLVRSSGGWTALMPLRAANGTLDAAAVKAALAAAGAHDAHFVDLKRESDRLYSGYLREASLLSLAGLAAILALLGVVTRSPRRVFHIVAPLAAAVAVVVAGLVLAGRPLIILHLVGMLLVVAVGSNYALFFDQGAAAGGVQARTLVSLLLASATTVAGFGVLAFSSVPVLNAIGTTVGPGVILALVFSAILARRP